MLKAKTFLVIIPARGGSKGGRAARRGRQRGGARSGECLVGASEAAESCGRRSSRSSLGSGQSVRSGEGGSVA